MQRERLTEDELRLARMKIFGTEEHVVRAKAHLETEDASRLRYACLELRLALERIAYKKLRQRIEALSPAELSRWQPAAVLKMLIEAVDPMLTQDFTLHVQKNAPASDDQDGFLLVGAHKGVDPRKLGGYYHKLGSFLHVSVPKTGDAPEEPDPEKMRSCIRDVIAYVEEMTSTGFEMFFLEKVTYTCIVCETPIVRNSRALKEGAIVHCHNPRCIASYTTVTKDGTLVLQERRARFRCTCGEVIKLHANELEEIPHDGSGTTSCKRCGATHRLRWGIHHDIDPPA